MALYLDTSCLLKLFFAERETERTIDLVSREERVVVSSLARLEALVQIQARVVGRMLSSSAAGRLVLRIDATMQTEPYELVPTPPTMIEAAEEQIRPLGRSVHCRTLDRLHLAAMQSLRLRRLLTNDDVQARAARALGFTVILPR